MKDFYNNVNVKEAHCPLLGTSCCISNDFESRDGTGSQMKQENDGWTGELKKRKRLREGGCKKQTGALV